MGQGKKKPILPGFTEKLNKCHPKRIREQLKRKKPKDYFSSFLSIVWGLTPISWLGFSRIRAEGTAWIWILPASLQRWARCQKEKSFQAFFTFIMGLSGLQSSLYFHEYLREQRSWGHGRRLQCYLNYLRRGEHKRLHPMQQWRSLRKQREGSLCLCFDWSCSRVHCSLKVSISEAEFQGLGKNTHLQAHHRGEWDKARCFSLVLTENISSYKQWQAVVKWQICHEYQMSDWKGVKQPWHQL